MLLDAGSALPSARRARPHGRGKAAGRKATVGAQREPPRGGRRWDTTTIALAGGEPGAVWPSCCCAAPRWPGRAPPPRSQCRVSASPARSPGHCGQVPIMVALDKGFFKAAGGAGRDLPGHPPPADLACSSVTAGSVRLLQPRLHRGDPGDGPRRHPASTTSPTSTTRWATRAACPPRLRQLQGPARPPRCAANTSGAGLTMVDGLLETQGMTEKIQFANLRRTRWRQQGQRQRRWPASAAAARRGGEGGARRKTARHRYGHAETTRKSKSRYRLTYEDLAQAGRRAPGPGAQAGDRNLPGWTSPCSTRMRWLETVCTIATSRRIRCSPEENVPLLAAPRISRSYMAAHRADAVPGAMVASRQQKDPQPARHREVGEYQFHSCPVIPASNPGRYPGR